MARTRKQATVLQLSVAAFLGVAAAIVVPASASADTYPVSTVDQLVQAVLDANANPGLDTIQIAAGTLVLDQDVPLITDDLEVFGAGSGLTTIDPQGGYTAFANDLAGPSESLRVEGLTIVDPLNAAISAENGELTVRDVVVDGGTAINLILPDAGGTGIIEDLEVSNAGDVGIYVRVSFAGDVTLTRVDAHDNAGAGAYLDVSGESLIVTDFTGTDNGDVGLFAAIYGAVGVFDGIQVEGNNGDGVYFEAVDGAEATFTGSNATDNGNAGFRMSATGGSDLTLTGLTSSLNDGPGFAITATESEVHGSALNAAGNGDDGLWIAADASTVELSGIESTDNDSDNLDASSVNSASSIALSNVFASGAGDNGIELSNETTDGLITLTGATSSGNDSSGARVDSAGSGGRVDIADSTFTGNGIGGGETCGIELGDDEGAGVVSTIARTTVAENDGAAAGICVIFIDAESGSIEVIDSTISGNDTEFGGVLAQLDGESSLSLLNSTISDNTVTEPGPGANLSIQGDQGGTGSVTVRSTTIVQGAGVGPNVLLFSVADVAIADSILAGSPESDLEASEVGSLQIDYSLVRAPGVGAEAAVEGGAANLTGMDPQLGELSANGGTTLTHLPAAASPVVNSGDPAYATPPAADQRGIGFDRVFAGRVDMGAVEVQSAATDEPDPLPATGVSTTPLVAIALGATLGGIGLVALVFLWRRRAEVLR